MHEQHKSHCYFIQLCVDADEAKDMSMLPSTVALMKSILLVYSSYYRVKVVITELNHGFGKQSSLTASEALPVLARSMTSTFRLCPLSCFALDAVLAPVYVEDDNEHSRLDLLPFSIFETRLIVDIE